MMGALQEPEQCPVRAGLGHAVQIKPGIDFLPSARKLRTLATPKRDQRRRRRRNIKFRRALDFRGWWQFRRGRGFPRDGCVGLRRSGLHRAGLFTQRFYLLGNTLPQVALFLAERALAAWWRR